MISLHAEGKRLGFFKSYKEIGEFLLKNGQTGTYYAWPRNAINPMVVMKTIQVVRRPTERIKLANGSFEEEPEVEVTMDGSRY
jgi:hypothetical protein